MGIPQECAAAEAYRLGDKTSKENNYILCNLGPFLLVHSSCNFTITFKSFDGNDTVHYQTNISMHSVVLSNTLKTPNTCITGISASFIQKLFLL